MPDERGTGDQFTERELALILKRASETQTTDAEPSRMRYSLAEIQEIALQAGIDRETIAAVAADLRRKPQKASWLLGGPTRFRAERTADAVVASAAFADIVEAIRAESGLQGEAKQVFDTLEWRGQDVGGGVFVTIAPRGEKTRVTVSAARTDEAVLVGMGGVGVAAVATGVAIAVSHAFHLPAAAAAMIALWTGGGAMVGATRLLWSRKVQKWERRATEIAEAVAARLKR